MQNKEHKTCVEDCKNKLTNSHNCMKESPIFRDGWHYLDLECFPNLDSKRTHRPTAIECENKNSILQRESNLKDLQEWKKKNPDGEIFQINNSNELNVSKLIKQSIAFVFPKAMGRRW